MLCNMSQEKLVEVVQNCPASMLQKFVPNVTAAITLTVVFNSSKLQWVARPDSGAGARPKRHAVLKFPFLAVMLVPGQQRLTVFCVLRPRPLHVLWQVQVRCRLVLRWSLLLEWCLKVFYLIRMM